MRIQVDARFPKKVLVLEPETEAEGYQLSAITKDCEAAGIETFEWSDFDSMRRGRSIVIQQPTAP